MYNSLTHPLTPVLCTPKNEAERKAWKLMFRMSFGANITPAQFKQYEIRLEKRCRKHSVEYVAPQLTDSVEAIHERRTRLQKKCKAAADKIRRSRPSVREKERAWQQSRNRKGNGPVNENKSSELRNLRITGRGGTPNYSYIPVAPYSTRCVMSEEDCCSVRSQLEPLTLGGQEQVELNKAIPICGSYDRVRVKKGRAVFMDGRRVKMCHTKDVLSAEIYVNDNCTKTGASVGFLPSAGFFSQVKESTTVWLGKGPNGNGYDDALEIYHGYFKVKGDRKNLRVMVVADIPEGGGNIIQEATRIVNEYDGITSGVNWNGKELYDYLNDQGVTQVRFEDVYFDVSVVRAGSNTHQIIQRKMMELDYKAGRTGDKPPALTRPESKDYSEAQSNIYYPLTPIFCIPRDSVEESEWKQRFLQSFHVTPVRFRLNENKLMEGCKKNSVRYIAPQLEDSVDETLRRKYTLNVKIKSSKCRERRRKRREELWEEERKRAEDSTRCNICFRGIDIRPYTGEFPYRPLGADPRYFKISLHHHHQPCKRDHRFHGKCWWKEFDFNQRIYRRFWLRKGQTWCPTCDKFYSPDWIEEVDETTGKKYYLNKKKTGMGTWEKPAGFGTT